MVIYFSDVWFLKPLDNNSIWHSIREAENKTLCRSTKWSLVVALKCKLVANKFDSSSATDIIFFRYRHNLLPLQTWSLVTLHFLSFVFLLYLSILLLKLLCEHLNIFSFLRFLILKLSYLDSNKTSFLRPING